jgi:hypothetical protein
MRDTLQKAQARIKHQIGKQETEREFERGCMIYLKLHSPFYGHFGVIDRIGKTTCRLSFLEGCQLYNVVHVSQLKKQLGPKQYMC